MNVRTHAELVNFIWGICNLLRGPHTRNEYRKVILPLTVLPRFDCVLDAFRSILAAAEMDLIPATLATWEDAARIRAETGLATPDALHAVTALGAGCTAFITNDTDFRRVDDLPIVVLDDLVEAETGV